MRFIPILLACGLGLSAFAVTSAHAGRGEPPYSLTHAATLSGTVPRIDLPPVSQKQLLKADADANASSQGESPDKRLRIAVPNRIDIDAARDGRWDVLPDGSRLWRIALHADGATDFRLGFSNFKVPQDATLHLVDPVSRNHVGPITAADTSPQGQLWLAPFPGNTPTIELRIPAGTDLAPGDVVLSNAGAGYRNATESGGPGLFGAGVSGTCNVDVVCPLGNPYPLEKRAVAKIYYDEPDGTYLCTGTLMNDTYQDFVPYFLTANHCVNTQAAATSMSLIWNYESPTCGAHGNATMQDVQYGGATLLAHRADVDFSLVRLNSQPSSAFQVAYAGWYASTGVPGGSIGIHHPSGWVKAITQNTHAPTTVNNCIGTGGGSTATHWRVGPYAQGTTEGGSSGSAIFIPAGDASGFGNRAIGILSGGSSECSGNVPNAGSDCYGKLSVAFDGPSPSQRLRDWLADGIFKSGFEAFTYFTSAAEASAPTVAAPQ